jgi:hypothetical protein
LYSQKQTLSGVTAEMDRAIQKSVKLIKLHSITVKPEIKKPTLTAEDLEFLAKRDYCNYVDDAYMLMGKSYFYKQDYAMAGRNFEFVLNEFKNEPIRFDALLWNVRTKIEAKQYEDAILLLSKIKEDPLFPEEKDTGIQFNLR